MGYCYQNLHFGRHRSKFKETRWFWMVRHEDWLVRRKLLLFRILVDGWKKLLERSSYNNDYYHIGHATEDAAFVSQVDIIKVHGESIENLLEQVDDDMTICIHLPV